MLGACGGGDVTLPPDGDPTAIVVLEGDKQQGRVGEPLADSLVVQVSDAQGRSVRGVTVAFEFGVAGAGANVVPQEKTTNSDGVAKAKLVLGTTIGPQTGRARVVTQEGREPVEASFTATALPENANSMAAVAGEDQTGHVNQPLDDRLVVEVTDGFGNPVAGVPINWAVGGGGSVSAEVVPTDEDGRSRVERILGPAVGQQTTIATANLAGSPVLFTHIAVAGDASRLTVVSGNDQTAEAGTQLPADLVVRLVDSEGNGVPNTAVTWVVATGGGTAGPQNTITDGEGRTSTQWTLGQAVGEQRLDAVVSGVGVAAFRATASAGAPAALLIRIQPAGTARNGIRLDRQPVIQLRDSRGNDVAAAGVQVTVQLEGGGELEGTTRRDTDGSGRATFDDLAISGEPGPRTLVFTASGYAPVTSNEIQLQGIGTTTTITGDSPDPSGVGATFTVSFRVASEGPTPTGSVTVSDGNQSCTGPLSNGVGSCQLALTTVGSRILTATYNGGPGLNGSSATEGHTVLATQPPPPATTTTTITSDTPDPSVSGTSFTVSFTVASSAGTPTGSVRVTVSGGAPTCTGSLSNGAGSCQLTLNTVGERTLTATYFGAAGFSASSDTEPHTVTVTPNQPPTAEFAVTCDELECRFEDRSNDPDGRIEDRLWDFGDGEASDNREPQHEYSSGGTYPVRLTVTDDDGATATVTHDVTVSEEAASTNTRFDVDSPDPTIPGQPFTIALEVESDDEDPDGTATVSDGVDGCTIQIVDGEGSCSLTLHTVGERTLTAIFQANARFATSSASERHTVNPTPPPPPAGTTTTITGDGDDPSQPGQAITVSFTVTSTSGTPDGNVQVTADGGGICNATVAQGSCPLTPGNSTTTITATYQGSSSFAGSSDTEPHSVNQPPSVGDDAANVTAGSSVTIPVLGNDSDPEGAELTITGITNGTNGTAAGAGGGGITYTPNPAYTGADDFTYTVSDGFLSSTATVRVTVTVPAASSLGILQQPSDDAESGRRFGRQPIIQLRDGSGSNLTISGVEVTAELSEGDGTLLGNDSITDGSGRAIFTDLAIDGEGDHRIEFTAAGYTSVRSDEIDVEEDD